MWVVIVVVVVGCLSLSFRTEFTVDSVAKSDVKHADTVEEAAQKYMTRVAIPTKGDNKVEATLSPQSIPDEVWKTYLDGSAGKEFQANRQRVREKTHPQQSSTDAGSGSWPGSGPSESESTSK